MIALIATLVGAGVGSAILTDLVRNFLLRRGVFDVPSERGLHTKPVVRGVGLAFASMWLVAAVTIALWDRGRTAGLPALILMGAGLTAIGLWDDIRHISPLPRLVGQLVVVAGAVLGGINTAEISVPGTRPVSLGHLAVPLCVLGLVALVNLFNFMDGIDGLVASQTLVAATVVTVAAAITGRTILALLAVALAAALAGFLPFNWSPARCFMGDAGSYFCGGIVGALLILGQSAGISLIVLGVANALFLLDGTATLLGRILHREPVWRPHRRHMYQRLAMRGWSHATVTGLYLAIAASLGAGSLVVLDSAK